MPSRFYKFTKFPSATFKKILVDVFTAILAHAHTHLFKWFRRHLFTPHQPSILTQFVYSSVFKSSQLIISRITAKRGANWVSV